MVQILCLLKIKCICHHVTMTSFDGFLCYLKEPPVCPLKKWSTNKTLQAGKCPKTTQLLRIIWMWVKLNVGEVKNFNVHWWTMSVEIFLYWWQKQHTISYIFSNILFHQHHGTPVAASCRWKVLYRFFHQF